MLVVHHLENSRSQRVLWLLEELGVPYDLKRYPRDPKTLLAPPELKKIHPLGKSPIVVDGDQTLVESGAVLQYLVDTYGGGRLQPTPDNAQRHRFWMHYAEGSLMPPLLLKLVFSKVASAPAPFFVKPILKGIAKKVSSQFVDPQLQLHLGFVESELARSTWFAGDELTAADMQMSFPMEAAAKRAGGDAYPRIADFVRRIHARPAYQRALERGGPFEIL